MSGNAEPTFKTEILRKVNGNPVLIIRDDSQREIARKEVNLCKIEGYEVLLDTKRIKLTEEQVKEIKAARSYVTKRPQINTYSKRVQASSGLTPISASPIPRQSWYTKDSFRPQPLTLHRSPLNLNLPQKISPIIKRRIVEEENDPNSNWGRFQQEKQTPLEKASISELLDAPRTPPSSKHRELSSISNLPKKKTSPVELSEFSESDSLEKELESFSAITRVPSKVPKTKRLGYDNTGQSCYCNSVIQTNLLLQLSCKNKQIHSIDIFFPITNLHAGI